MRENLKRNNYPENNADSKTDIINSCYASVGGATRSCCLSFIHYASVGGATRHTVIALSVILSVCLSVSLSVTQFLRRTLNGEL